jgi:hypothetical protein
MIQSLTQVFQTEQGELQIVDVMNKQVEHLEDLLDLYRELFPQYTSALDGVRNRANSPTDSDPRFVHHQWVVLLNGMPVGMTSFRLAVKHGFGLGLSLAIRPTYRRIALEKHKRLSDLIIEQTLAQMEFDATNHGQKFIGMIIEVEAPDSLEDPDQKKSREDLLARYQRSGFIFLPIISHEPAFIRKDGVDSSLPDKTSPPMRLCILPAQSNDKINMLEAGMLHQVIDVLLIDHYGLEEDHWIVKQARASVSTQGK